jgi:hypothetical protein
MIFSRVPKIGIELAGCTLGDSVVLKLHRTRMSKNPAKPTTREQRLLKAIAELHRVVEKLQEAVAALRAERRSVKAKRNWK